MLQRICPVCDHGNDLAASDCAACGAALIAPLAQRTATPLALRLPHIPERWQPAAQAVALGAAALALEVGSALLRKGRPAATGTALARTAPAAGPRVIRRRVWRTYRDGVLTGEVAEETQWLAE